MLFLLFLLLLLMMLLKFTAFLSAMLPFLTEMQVCFKTSLLQANNLLLFSQCQRIYSYVN